METSIIHGTGLHQSDGPVLRPARHATPDAVRAFFAAYDPLSADRATPDQRLPACPICGRSQAPDVLARGAGCACGLTAPERAILHVLQREFPAFPLGTTAVVGRPEVSAAAAALSLGAPAETAAAALGEATALDCLVLTDPAALDRDGARAWLSRLRPGGGALLLLAPDIEAEACLELMEHCRLAGCAEVALLDPWCPALGYVGPGLPCLLVRRTPPARPAPAIRPARTPNRSRAGVSVVIPLYNHQRYIEAALDSVFGQSTPPAEVIVIDDGSSDSSAAIASRLCAGYPGAVFWGQPNRGAHNTINTGLMRATCPVVAILNSDDIYHPNRLERCLHALEEQDADLVASDIRFINEHEAAIENPWYDQALAHWRQVGNTALALLNGNFLMTTSNLVMRRRVFERSGLFRDFRYAHDLDFFIRVLGDGHRLAFLDEPLLRYRYHPCNTIQENHTKVRAEWAFICALVLRHAPAPLLEGLDRWEFGDALDGIIQTHQLGRGVLLIAQALFETNRQADFRLLTGCPELLERVYRSLA